jgi:diguanylate cyclase (GGDEF)-like protein
LYNDHYGHVRGDDCLKQVAATLRNAVTRPRDFLCRYGGEEFALLLPETDAVGAEQVAKNCLASMLRASIPHDASQVASIITLSAGVGTSTPSPGESLVQLLERVDKRLYLAKQSGRNAIVPS